MTLYPDGYGYGYRARLTEAQVRSAHPGMETEYEARWFEFMRAAGGLIGIGGGWRPTPSDTSAASRAGHSFHQWQTFADGQRAWCAVDLVGVDNRQGEARAWAVENCARFGLVTFNAVNDEPWHVQPADIPHGWTDWANAGRPNPKPGNRPPGDDDVTDEDIERIAAKVWAHPLNTVDGQMSTGSAVGRTYSQTTPDEMAESVWAKTINVATHDTPQKVGSVLGWIWNRVHG